MFRGKQVFRYKSIEEFIEAHIKGAKALEEKQESVKGVLSGQPVASSPQRQL
jgi:hypothetical protein